MIENVKCPECDGPMTSRANRTTGQRFWGCNNYPRCKGTRDTDGEAAKFRQPRDDDDGRYRADGRSVRGRIRRKLLAGSTAAVIHCPDAPMTVEPADAAVLASAPDLLAACKAVMGQFDAGALCRNTDSDGCSDWAIRAVEPLRALAELKAAIAKAEGR
jgi:ssDNA-binding Zn-finger/Zn-ribbon topoisomerase 1